MASHSTCTIPQELKDQFKNFKTKEKPRSAFIMKVNQDKLEVELEEIQRDVSMEDIAAELPESAPRYIAYNAEFTWPDGRKSFPLIFIFYCPKVVSPTNGTMYASTKPRLVNDLAIMKIFDIRDSEEMTTEWMNKKLEFFK